MPVPASLNDLSTVAGSNPPSGGETPTEGDNHFRFSYACLATLRDKLNGVSDTGTVKNAAFSGTQTGASTWSGLQTFSGGATVTGLNVSGTGGNVNGGTYTTAIGPGGSTNFDFALHYTCKWDRTANTVRVAGVIDVRPLAAGSVALRITIPVASNFTTAVDLCGNGTANNGTTFLPVLFLADQTNDNCLITFNAAAAVTYTIGFNFGYEVK